MSLVPLDYGSTDDDSEENDHDGESCRGESQSSSSSKEASAGTDVGYSHSRTPSTDQLLSSKQSSANFKSSARRITFHGKASDVTVSVHELLDGTYGSFVWPSALVLSAYVHFLGSAFRGKRVLELGCGTALPGLVAAKLGAAQVVLTDSRQLPHVLANTELAVRANRCEETCAVAALEWGEFPPLVGDPCAFDYVLGADVFYEPEMFDTLLATVVYILKKSPPSAAFITAYQERSSRRSVQHLLDRYGLTCTLVDKADFGGWGGDTWSLANDAYYSPPREIASVVLLIIKMVS
ncbi:putative methyltransferase-domain-containing protein [Powellomyces hirtus]|nr:putative methyltransferase-domain-containing protein [Powellomyces hirtus]